MSKPFKNFTLAMFRQWFGEEPEDKTYTALEIWKMLDEACPLLPDTLKKQEEKDEIDQHIEDTERILEKGEKILNRMKEIEQEVKYTNSPDTINSEKDVNKPPKKVATSEKEKKCEWCSGVMQSNLNCPNCKILKFPDKETECDCHRVALCPKKYPDIEPRVFIKNCEECGKGLESKNQETIHKKMRHPTPPESEDWAKEVLSRYNAEILNKFQDEYLMARGPGCEEILYPVLTKALKDFIDPPNDGMVRKFNLKEFISSKSYQRGREEVSGKEIQEYYERGQAESRQQTLKEVLDYLQKNHLDYCKEQNGLNYCKNCGLSIEDIIKHFKIK